MRHLHVQEHGGFREIWHHYPFWVFVIAVLVTALLFALFFFTQGGGGEAGYPPYNPYLWYY